MKPRVLHLRASNFVGGPEKQILAYARSCADSVETIIGSFCADAEGAELLRAAASQGTATLALPAHSLSQSVRRLTQAVRDSDVRLICAHGYKPALLASMVSRMTKIPYACFLRGWTKEDRKVAIYEMVERWCARHAERVVCLSDMQASRLSNRYKSRIRVVVNAATVRDSTPQQRQAYKQQICAIAGLDPARPVAVAAGRLSPEKGASVLVQAAAILRESCPAVQFVVFGDGVERERLQRQISELKIEANFKLAGYRENFSELIAGADLLVNPSLTEEVPNVVLEAMSAGVPVVATAVGGVPDLGRDGAIALVSPGDSRLLAEAIAAVFRESSDPDAMVRKARARLSEDYSPAKQSEQLHGLYSEFFPTGPEADSARLPRISVLIPVRNEEKRIGSVLEMFRDQEYPADRFEIIVADGISTDRTAEVVESYASKSGVKIRLVNNPGRLSSCGRNAAVAASTGEIVVFSDGHCYVPSRTLLRDAAELFSRTEAGILCRPQPLDFPGSNSFQQTVAAARASWLGHGRDSTIYSTSCEGYVDPSSAGAMYRRELFDQFGGFDESFDACEDVEFNHRLHCAGVRAYISAKLTVFYEPRKSLRKLFQQMMRYGRGRVRLARKHPGSSSFSTLLPAGLVVFLAAGIVAAFTPFFRWWLVAFAVYAGVVLAESFRVAARSGAKKILMLPAVFTAIHTGLGTGLIREWLAGKRLTRSGTTAFVEKQEYADEMKLIEEASTRQEIGTR